MCFSSERDQLFDGALVYHENCQVDKLLSSRKTLMRLKQSDEFHCCYILMYCCDVSCFRYFVHLLRSALYPEL